MNIFEIKKYGTGKSGVSIGNRLISTVFTFVIVCKLQRKNRNFIYNNILIYCRYEV
jgi:hypothetical protein